MSKFQYLITVKPLGFMYGSAGAFLSPENLVGRSGAKFPPDTATLAGLFFNANREHKFADRTELRNHLVISGPFWAKQDTPKKFYVPIPWHNVIAEKEDDEWFLIKKESNKQETVELDENKWCLGQHRWKRNNKDLKPEYSWQSINTWNLPPEELRERQAIEKSPWEFTSFLHPRIKAEERHVVEKDGLFLENAVQFHEEYCLVYLSGTDLDKNKLVVVGDNDIAMLHDMALYRQSRVKLLDEMKKVDTGAFFNTEALPEGSVLVFPIALKQKGWKPFADENSSELYFGGLESIGFGRCRVSLAGEYQ
ncbi:MAG: type III-B CRISPR module-associated Cmr3 family protein [Coleofasciculaceae cyanobacterium]